MAEIGPQNPGESPAGKDIPLAKAGDKDSAQTTAAGTGEKGNPQPTEPKAKTPAEPAEADKIQAKTAQPASKAPAASKPAKGKPRSRRFWLRGRWRQLKIVRSPVKTFAASVPAKDPPKPRRFWSLGGWQFWVPGILFFGLMVFPFGITYWGWKFDHDGLSLDSDGGILNFWVWQCAVPANFLSQCASLMLTYFVSVFGGHILVVTGLRFFAEYKESVHPLAWGVGWIERFIYTSGVLLGLPFATIGGWIVLKGLAQFRQQGGKEYSTKEFLTDYYSYIIGTGLSLIVGVGAGLLGRELLGYSGVPSFGPP